MHRGGIADKAGNRYEAKWLIYKLFSLLSGDVLSVTVEKLGDDMEGFEFLLEYPARIEWHQCKRQTKGVSWTIRSLEQQDVLKNFAARLEADSRATCLFVSTDTASAIKALREKQPQFDSVDPYVASLSKTEKEDWENLVKIIGTQGDTFDWLARCEFRAQSEEGLDEIVKDSSLRWVKADPETLRGILRKWVEEDGNMNRPLTRGDLLAELRARGLQVNAYHLDQSLPGKIDAANNEYCDSYRPAGNGHFSVVRPETERLYAEITEGSFRIIILAGTAGAGKSVVVKTVLERLSSNHIRHLAFRADQLGEPASVDAIGSRTLSIEDSPAVILEHVAGQHQAVIFIDQADALSEMSGRSPAARASLVNLIKQAANYEHVKIVFCCRPFDLENDHQYGKLLEREDTVRIDVAPLDWDRDVLPVLESHGVIVDANNEQLKKLLVLPVGLTLAIDLSLMGTKDLRYFYHLSQLYDALLKGHNLEVQGDASLQWTIYKPLEAIANAMSDRQELSAHLRVLDDFPKAESTLQRQGLIVVNGNKISLRHESLFDYLHARAFVGDGKSLMNLLQAEEQTLFRRTQVRQILSQLREEDRSTYFTELRALLTSTAVRQHIKEFVLTWLTTVPDPSPQEWDSVVAYAEGFSRFGIRGTGTVIYRSAAWFRLLRGLGVISDFLVHADEDVRRWGLGFLRTIASEASEDVAYDLGQLLDSGQISPLEFLNRFFWLPIERPAPKLADILISALDRWDGAALSQGSDGPLEIAATWAEKAPEDASRIFGAALSAWERTHPEIPVFDALDKINASHYVELMARGAPKAFLQVVVPFMHSELTRTPSCDYPVAGGRWGYRTDRTEEPYKEFIDHVRDAFARLARTDPAVCSNLLLALEPDKYVAALHLLLSAVPHNPRALADLVKSQKYNRALFEAGSMNSPSSTAVAAIKACWDTVSAEEWLDIQKLILGLWPELVAAADHYRHSKTNPGDGYYTAEGLREWSRQCLMISGLRQWSVLQSLSPASLSPDTTRRLEQLERKFRGHHSPETPPFSADVGKDSPPPRPLKLSRLPDARLLEAFEGLEVSQNRRPRSRFGTGDSEIFNELISTAREVPSRVLSLLQKMDAPISPQVIDTVVRGFGDAVLTPKDVETLVSVVQDKAIVPSFSLIWLLQARRGAWLTKTPEFLSDLVLSSANESNLGPFEKTDAKTALDRAVKHGSHVTTQLMNSIRGLSLNAVAQHSLTDSATYGRLDRLFDDLLDQNNPPFIYAALWPFLRSGLAIDPVKVAARANRMFDRAPQSFLTDEARHTVYRLESKEQDAGRQLIARLTACDDPDVHLIGALLTLDKAYGSPDFRSDADALLARGDDYRIISVVLATSYITTEGFRVVATDVLINAFGDPNEEIRRAAAKCFNRLEGNDLRKNESLYRAFVASPYLKVDQKFLPTLATTALVYDTLLLDFIDEIVRRAQEATETTSHSLYSLWDQVLRIYSSNRFDKIKVSRCLDIIDTLYKLGTSGDAKLANL